jgi:SAM-dependent methyltransferase
MAAPVNPVAQSHQRGIPPTLQELADLYHLKHGDLAAAGWSVRQRSRFGYFLPDDWYEALIYRFVTPQTHWLDVGGGASLFPHNSNLAAKLAGVCALLVGVDPSPNIQLNPFVFERAQCLIEDFRTEHRFDLITLRMVAEHITDPHTAVHALQRLLRPGGRIVVYTVNIRTPIALLARLVPFRLHHPIKKLFWGGEDKDTFPVAYKMNTRKQLTQLFEQAGLHEELFLYLDDCSAFGLFRTLSWLELLAWRSCRWLGMSYPENCLLGVYS